MHTISELAHTGDVLACVEALHGWLDDIVADELSVTDDAEGHPRLDHARPITEMPTPSTTDPSAAPSRPRI